MKIITRSLRHAGLAISLLLGSVACAFAQETYMARETAYAISNKAEQGYLGNVEMDEAQREIRLYFVTATKAKKIKMEKYIFDFDLNFKTSEKEEYDKPKDLKSKYGWFKFRNEEVETVVGVTAEPNMMGNLVFKRKEITNYWSWFSGGYKTKVNVTDKLKPKGEDGKKFFYRNHFDNDENGEVLALVSPKYGGANYNKMQEEYSILRVNTNLEIVSTTQIKFDKPQWNIFSGRYTFAGASDEDLYHGDYVAIFAPFDGAGVKNASEKPTEYTYVRISPEGEVKEQVTFETKSARWQIEGVYDRDGVVTIYGAGFRIKKPSDAYGNLKNYNPAEDAKGFDNFQLATIKGGKVDFVTAPNLEEMATKTAAPAGQKKAKEYDGGRLQVTGLETAGNGDIMVMAQMVNKNFKSHQFVYKDFMVLHFNGKGDLKKLYSIDSPAKGGLANATDPASSPAMRASSSNIFLGADGKSAYWMTGLVTKVDKATQSYYFSGSSVTTYTPREQLLIGRIDLENNTMGQVIETGDGAKGKKDFFLRQDIRYVPYNNSNGLLVIGEDRGGLGLFSKSGNYIYLGMIDMSAK